MAYDDTSPAQGHQALSDIDLIRANTNELRKCEASLSSAPPSNAVKAQFWWQTDTKKLYQRNEANTTWLLVWMEEGSGYGPAWYHTAGFDATERNVKNHFDKNITAAITVHGIKQGSGNLFDADLLDGYEAAAFLAAAHGTASSGVHGSGASILLHLPTNIPILVIASTAPTGWTQNTTYNDKVIRIVSGAGGGTGGSWTISGLSSASGGVDHTHAGGSHTHTVTRNGWNRTSTGFDYPSNSESFLSISPGEQSISIPNYWRYSNIPTGDKTSGASSGTTGGASAYSHSHTISADGSWRPAFLDMIAVTKNA